jgi:hypothetical protein
MTPPRRLLITRMPDRAAAVLAAAQELAYPLFLEGSAELSQRMLNQGKQFLPFCRPRQSNIEQGLSENRLSRDLRRR